MPLKNQDLGALGVAETALRSGLGRLFALAEDYPELRANQSFQIYRPRISDLENSIADRRELYNDVVNMNNIRIETDPPMSSLRISSSLGPMNYWSLPKKKRLMWI